VKCKENTAQHNTERQGLESFPSFFKPIKGSYP